MELSQFLTLSIEFSIFLEGCKNSKISMQKSMFAHISRLTFLKEIQNSVYEVDQPKNLHIFLAMKILELENLQFLSALAGNRTQHLWGNTQLC
jgi:hypothetical protein